MLVRLFRIALCAAPDSFRRAYGAQLRRDFSDALRDERNARGTLGVALFALRAFTDVVSSGIRERAATLARDFGFALRSMRKAPLFTFVIVATLAVAIGANATAFSVLYGVVLAPLPYPQSDRLVAVHHKLHGFFAGFSIPDFEDYRAGNDTLRSFAAWTNIGSRLTYRGRAFALEGIGTTPELFNAFEEKPELGRFVTASDGRIGAPRAIVISDAIWRRVFGAAPTIVGTQAHLDGRAVTVVGVAAPGTEQPEQGVGLFKPDFWSALQPYGPDYARSESYFQAVARLRYGVTLAAARADLRTIHARLVARYPKADGRVEIAVDPLIDTTVGQARPFLFAMFAAVVGVLLIACANVANLLLSRGATRDRELAIRTASGATRGRIIAQLLTEAFVLAAAGGLAGIVVCAVALNAFIATAPDLPRAATLAFNFTPVLYTLGIVAFCTLAAGLVPALVLSRREVSAALKAAGRGGDASRGARVRSGLIVTEIALTLALVVASTLVVRSFMVLTQQPLGFSPTNVLVTSQIEVPAQRNFTNPDSATGDFDAATSPAMVADFTAFYARILGRVRAIPGVEQVSTAAFAPFGGTFYNTEFSIVGRSMSSNALPHTAFEPIAPGYFDLLRIPIVEGRSFTSRDRLGATSIAVVNEAFVHAYIPHRSALGMHISQKLRLGGSERFADRTIVGVAADSRLDYEDAPFPMLYLPLAQVPQNQAVLVIRTRRGVHVEPAVAAAVTQGNPLVPAPTVRTVASYMSDDAADARLGAVTLGALGLVGFILTIAGIYAVVSYGVSQRTHELGVHMALGARAPDLVRRVIGGALVLVALGVLLGLLLAAWSVELVADQLYGIKPFDPSTFVIVIVAIVLASAVAALVPARRATRVDPIVALRYE